MKTHLIPALLFTLVATAAGAHDYKLGPLVIDHPWSRATPKGAPVAGGYLKITNTGTTPDRLTGGSAEIAKRFEIHEMRMDGGVMKMRELTKGLEIPAGATVELKPGSYHVMMMGLSQGADQGRAGQGVAALREGRQGRYRVRRRGGRRDAGRAGPGEGAQALIRMPRADHQPIARGSQVAMPGKMKHSTSARTCIATNGMMPR